jgi:transcriptional regulator with XRE-family HTH domain
MGTTQAFIARLESGKGLPSTRTLAKFAKATNTKLRISFEPEV